MRIPLQQRAHSPRYSWHPPVVDVHCHLVRRMLAEAGLTLWSHAPPQPSNAVLDEIYAQHDDMYRTRH